MDVTLLFTDIEGSTVLARELGERWAEVLTLHHEILATAITSHGGEVVKAEGDAFFAMFEDAAEAVACTLEAQQALDGARWPHGGVVKVRMGLHHGSVEFLEAANELVGFDIHEAARIASTAHGGQVVLSDAVERACDGRLPAGTSLVDLGLHGLKDIPVDRRIYQLAHPDLAGTFPPLRSLTASAHNLIHPPTPLVGREALVRDVADLVLGDSRLVTLTGEGGIGKTRLATECAWNLLARFPDGVWFVSLADTTDPDQVVPAIAATIGVDVGSRDPYEALVAEIGDSSVLVVLDNLEQLGDGVTAVSDLIGACGRLRVLATSRDRLRLRAEQRVKVDPLTVPGGDTQSDVASSGAARLFLDRAVAHGEAIPLDDTTTPLVAEICRRVDGLPLAIELAAARVPDMALEAILRGLEGAIDLLSEGDRDLPPRQQALQATIAWSLDLLEADQQSCFRRCAVFGGPFDTDALATVMHVDVGVAQALSDRVEASGLIRRATDDAAASLRWTMLVPLRTHGRALLREHGELDQANERLVEEMATRAARLAPQLLGSRQAVTLRTLEEDHANLVLALDVAAPEPAAALAFDLFRYFRLGNHVRQGVRVIEQITERGEVSAVGRTKLAISLIGMLGPLEEHERALAVAEQGQSALDEIDSDDDRRHELEAILCALHANELAVGARDQFVSDDADQRLDDERLSRVEPLMDRAIAAAERAGDRRLRVNVVHVQATLRWSMGMYAEAAEEYLDLARTWSDLRDGAAEVDARVSAVMALAAAGDHTTAIDHALAVLDLSRERERPQSELLALDALARSSLEVDDRRGPGWAFAASDLAEDIGSPMARFRHADLAERWAYRLHDVDASLTYMRRALDAAVDLGRDDWVEALTTTIDDMERNGIPDLGD